MLINGVQVFPHGNGYGCGLPNPCIGLIVIRIRGFFQPRDAKLLQTLCHLNGSCFIPGHIGIYHKNSLVPYEAAHRPYPGNILIPILSAQLNLKCIVPLPHLVFNLA